MLTSFTVPMLLCLRMCTSNALQHQADQARRCTTSLLSLLLTIIRRERMGVSCIEHHERHMICSRTY